MKYDYLKTGILVRIKLGNQKTCSCVLATIKICQINSNHTKMVELCIPYVLNNMLVTVPASGYNIHALSFNCCILSVIYIWLAEKPECTRETIRETYKEP